jgi:hypothetical protein
MTPLTQSVRWPAQLRATTLTRCATHFELGRLQDIAVAADDATLVAFGDLADALGAGFEIDHGFHGGIDRRSLQDHNRELSMSVSRTRSEVVGTPPNRRD